MRSPKLAALELKRFGRGKLPRAALAALLLLPLLYGALYLWSFWDPYGKLNKIPVALVNSDTGATVKGEHLTAGDDITDKLLDSETFDWHPTSAAEARKGVANGTYYLSLTVPQDFSRQIASSSGKSPETGALKVRTDDANNYIVGQISRSVFSEVRAAASTKASRGFYDNIFISFADIHGETENAANSADKLGKGIGKAKKGADDLAKGLAKAKEGSRDLKSGLGSLYKGSGTLETGAGGVADGTQSLSDKVNDVAAKVRPFLKEHGKEIGDISQLVADASQKASDNLDTLPEKTSTAATKARKASDDLAADYRTRCEGAVPTDPDCPALKKSVAAAGTAADVAEDVNKLVQDHTGQLDTLGGHLDDLHGQALWLAHNAPHLDTDLDSAVRKINTLNSGARKVAKGAGTLHTGLSSAKTGASDLDSGVGKARGGADTLGGGMYRLVDGSGKLSGGLHDGAAKIPDYASRTGTPVRR